jgi:hypothetical protein
MVGSLDGGTAAIGGQGGAGDVARLVRGEEGNELGDLSGLGSSLDGGRGADGVEQRAAGRMK